jgi:hypothetical protein
MRTPEANSILEKVIQSVEKNGMDASAIIPELQKAREYALKEEDPLLTRALRLAWQHLEANESFDIDLAEDIETMEENFVYFLQLCLRCENSLNRDELREMTTSLQQLA